MTEQNNISRTARTLLPLVLSLSLLLPEATSCMKEMSDQFGDNVIMGYNVLVTVRPAIGDAPFRLVLNDSTTLYPTNLSSSPFKDKIVRAYGAVTPTRGNLQDFTEGGEFDVFVHQLDSIVTKVMRMNVESLLDENGDPIHSDPIDVLDRWDTVVEDGFLTINFCTTFGWERIHSIDLIPTSQPGEVRLVHNANGDTSGTVSTGTIAFSLAGLNESSKDEKGYKTLTLRYDSFNGPAKRTFKYK